MPTNQIVLTALKGVLWNSASEGDADYSEVTQAIAQLQAKGVAVVVFTDCDRAEVEPIRQQLGLTAPFITESGSAIFTLLEHNPFDPALGEKDGEYTVEVLGCPYVQARAGLRVIANVISHPLKGFGDFTVEQLKRSAKISEAAAHRAKAREFSEPFMTPKAVEPQTLQSAAEEMGFGVILRSPEEGRFSELIGAEAGLGKAAQQLIERYQQSLEGDGVLKVMGISDRPQELSLLAEATQTVSPSIEWTSALVSEAETAPAQWLDAVASLLT